MLRYNAGSKSTLWRSLLITFRKQVPRTPFNVATDCVNTRSRNIYASKFENKWELHCTPMGYPASRIKQKLLAAAKRQDFETYSHLLSNLKMVSQKASRTWPDPSHRMRLYQSYHKQVTCHMSITCTVARVKDARSYFRGQSVECVQLRLRYRIQIDDAPRGCSGASEARRTMNSSSGYVLHHFTK